jgi:hypothetical protein
VVNEHARRLTPDIPAVNANDENPAIEHHGGSLDHASGVQNNI